MRRATKAAAVATGAVVVVAFFFLAPVVFWYDQQPPIEGQQVTAYAAPVYRSLGCAAVGVGDMYSPGWFGLSFGCRPPILV